MEHGDGDPGLTDRRGDLLKILKIVRSARASSKSGDAIPLARSMVVLIWSWKQMMRVVLRKLRLMKAILGGVRVLSAVAN